jgi:hypothetical protein
MTARLAAAALVSALGVGFAAGCGGDEAARERGGVEADRPDVSAQVAARNLLAKREGGCDCTGEARARERIADGRATRRTEPVVLGG